MCPFYAPYEGTFSYTFIYTLFMYLFMYLMKVPFHVLFFMYPYVPYEGTFSYTFHVPFMYPSSIATAFPSSIIPKHAKLCRRPRYAKLRLSPN